jgi:hypothetical protein
LSVRIEPGVLSEAITGRTAARNLLATARALQSAPMPAPAS